MREDNEVYLARAGAARGESTNGDPVFWVSCSLSGLGKIVLRNPAS